MKVIARIAATAAAVAGLGLVGLGAATDAHAQPGPFPQWCPGEFWDPGWGNNWDWNGCHDWRGGPPGYGAGGLDPAWTGRGSWVGPGPSRLGPGWTRWAWLGSRRTAAARLAPLIEVR